MICTTCGRDNPEHLVFCQECGQRLRPRVAPPTPPIGLAPPPQFAAALAPAAPLAPPAPAVPGFPAPGAAPVPTPLASAVAPKRVEDPGPSSNALRPQAPDFRFAPRAPGASEAVVPSAAAPVRCVMCGSSNQRGLRFCVTCGHPLAAPREPSEAPPRPTEPTVRPEPAAVSRATAPLTSAARSIQQTEGADESAPPDLGSTSPMDRTGPPAAAIAPTRVVDVGSPAAPLRPATRVCARCRGASDAGALFCKFCGAPLAEGAAAGAPAPSPPSSRSRRPRHPPSHRRRARKRHVGPA